MAYTYPEDYLSWYIVGDRLALVTSNNTSANNLYEAIDETQDDGILIEYSSQPNEVVNLSDVPDCDDTLHTALVDYIKWKLYDDRTDEASLIQGDKFRRRWRRSLRLDAGRDKIGGLRQIAPYPLA